EVLKANSHDIDGLITRGQIQLRKGDINGAIDSLQTAVKNDADNGVAHYQLGLALEAQHNEGQAVHEWQEAVRLRPDLSDAQRALALSAVRRGDLDAVTQAAQQIITIEPSSGDGYLLRAAAETSREKFTEAETDLQAAMQRSPQSSAPYI